MRNLVSERSNFAQTHKQSVDELVPSIGGLSNSSLFTFQEYWALNADRSVSAPG